MTYTVHYYRVCTNNFGSPNKLVQLIQLFRLNKGTIRVKSDSGKIGNVPASRFHVDKSTGALIYVPRQNHVGYVLEEYSNSSMSFEAQVELFTSYEPTYDCANCGCPDVFTICPICGSTHLELRQTREEFEEVHRRRQ